MLSVTRVDLVHVVGQQQPGNINQLGRAYATLGKIARGNMVYLFSVAVQVLDER